MKKYIFLLKVGVCFLGLQPLFAENQPDSLKYKGAYDSFVIDQSWIEDSPEYDVAKALYGKIPGLVVHQGKGSSSDNLSVLSLNGQDPLILIDGFPRPISDITIDEISTIQVLKDATATAMYGVRGANGVVLITTKRGKNQKLKVTAKYQYGLNTQFRAPEFADAYTYATYQNEALVLDGLEPRYNSMELEMFKNGSSPYFYPNVNWMEEVYNDVASNHRVGFTFTGGNEKFRYFSAIDYMKDVSLFRNQSTDSRYDATNKDTRLGVRANIDVDLTPSTLLTLGMMARISEANRANPEGGMSTFYKSLYRTPSAVFPIKDMNGVYGGSSLYGATNPVALLNDVGNYKVSKSTVLANINLNQDLSALMKGLSADVSVGFDYLGAATDVSKKEFKYIEYNPTIIDGGTVVTNPNVVGVDSRTLVHESWFQNLTMTSELHARLKYDYSNTNHTIGAAVQYLQNAYSTKGRNNSTKRQSFLGTLSYNYGQRYFIDAVANYSGTAYLEEGDKYRMYPAVSAGWLISNEKFFKKGNLVDHLKFSASYGKSGNDGNLEHELHLSSYVNSGSYFFTKSVTELWGWKENKLPVENLSPELSERFTFGFNGLFLKKKLSLFADVFKETRSHILVETANVSGVVGVDTGLESSGSMEAQGIDFGFKWGNQIKDFNYSIWGTGTYLESKIIDMKQPFQPYDYLYRMGNEVNQMYGLEAIGIFQDQIQINNSPQQTFSTVRPGDIMYKDQNGDNVIDGNDVVRMFGSSTPKFYFGFGVNMAYKRFSISADFQGQTGVTVNLLDSPLYKPMSENGTISTTFLDEEVTWSPERASEATMPRLTTQSNVNNYRNSSMWYRDGSFIKLRNLSLAYRIPKDFVRIADLTISLQGTNLFSFDNLKFADPEQLNATYPTTRSYWVSLKCDF